MNVSVAARHMDLTNGLKDHVEKLLTRVYEHYDRITQADVVLTVEKHRHIAEVTLKANGFRIHGKEATEDMYASVDKVVDKIESQVKKHKGRMSRFKYRPVETVRDYSHHIVALPWEREAPETVEDAEHRVIHHEKIEAKRMDVHDAAMHLDLGNQPFYVFENEDTGRLCVIYKHEEDGTYGVIEP